jgi:peptidoglycan L-alanyl-D-glutamate endopeptidase CwlK
MLTKDILFFQRLLHADGLYQDTLDGQWGPNTEKASNLFDQRAEQIRAETRSFDIRSENNILTLSLKAQRQARLCLSRLIDGGVRARILSGTRTYEEQNALFRQGRFGNPGPKVTEARGGQSNHNFGVAWDIGIFTAEGGYVTDEAAYKTAGAIAMGPGSEAVEWGGSWTKFVDYPHYQLKLGLGLAELRTAFEEGSGIPQLTALA